MRTFNWTNKDLNQISLASVLIESGALDSCKVMIIENVERRLVDNLLNYKSQTKSYDINFLKSLSDTNHITSHPYSSHPHVESLKHIANSVRFGLGLKKTEMIAMDLCSEFFSSKRFSNKLIFRQEELNFMHHDPAMIITSIDIMNKLHEEALSRGIFLIFMVAAGSFDLYQDYIVDNPYPKDTTLDYFDDLDTTWFLNTKKLIKPYIDAGEKDMVLLNDTHWSIKSAKLAGEKLGEMIKEYYDSSRK